MKHIPFLKALNSFFLLIIASNLFGEELALEHWVKGGGFIYRSTERIITLENASDQEIKISNIQLSLPPRGLYILPKAVQELQVHALPKGILKIGHLTGGCSKAINDSIQQAVSPYLMPDSHPIKAQLDKIFSKTRVLADRKAAKKAGFTWSTDYKDHRPILRHPSMKGYVLKVYFDRKKEEDWPHWIERCRGAIVIRNTIKSHGFEHIFTVPEKWIYALPSNAPKGKGRFPKYFVLVAQDCPIYPAKENLRLYKELSSKKLLQAIYIMIRDTGLLDGARPDNLCFTKDLKLAFIDTELYHRPSPQYHELDEFLSPAMRKVWKRLIETNGLETD